jgi:AbrB family looped-hinge helix DNA binding protein
MKKRIEMQEITRVSSKGQIVIPSSIRKGMGVKEGSLFTIAARRNMIILKKLDTKMSADDIRTMKLIEGAWKEIEEGKYEVHTKKEFLKELKKW